MCCALKRSTGILKFRYTLVTRPTEKKTIGFYSKNKLLRNIYVYKTIIVSGEQKKSHSYIKKLHNTFETNRKKLILKIKSIETI